LGGKKNIGKAKGRRQRNGREETILPVEKDGLGLSTPQRG